MGSAAATYPLLYLNRPTSVPLICNYTEKYYIIKSINN